MTLPDDQHPPTPEHRHHPLLRLTVSACPDDDAALLVDVDVGPPLAGWTADQVATALATMLDGGLAPNLDARWRAWMAARN